MPASFMTLFPNTLNAIEAMKLPLQASSTFSEMVIRSNSLGFRLMDNAHDFGCQLMKQFMPLTIPAIDKEKSSQICEIYQEASQSLLSIGETTLQKHMSRFHQKRRGELEFLRFLTESPPPQEWTVEYDDGKVLLDLPSIRLIDISKDVKHNIQNYGVVFAPRAGHHSNIAERVAIYLRDQGITRMAIVEQKCARDIPFHVNGRRHYEGFDGQVEQYRKVLAHLKKTTGFPSHLIAICQPGPLLMSTLIQYPQLGKTFGSAGAPMHTEGETGFLTDFSRLVGEDYIDRLIALFGKTVDDQHIGAGREIHDGRIHILGFYILGADQHFKNLRKLLSDLREGNEEASQRQRAFYQWYNYTHDFAGGFVRDTFKKIFVRNELIKGTLTINGKKIGIKDYPNSVPVWALGGINDNIAPPLQATGHMGLIDSVPDEDKLKLVCEGGHTGLFRSTKILEKYYSRIAKFILAKSDKKELL